MGERGKGRARENPKNIDGERKSEIDRGLERQKCLSERVRVEKAISLVGSSFRSIVFNRPFRKRDLGKCKVGQIERQISGVLLI